MIQKTMRPIFVIGAARSGTTAIVLGFIKGAGIPGYLEGHTLPLLNQLHQTVDDYVVVLDRRILAVKEKPLIGWLDAEELKNHITAKFVRIIEERLGFDVWVDKTPGDRMIRAVPRLAAIFPQARFVFAKRRGIENVLSRTIKFPGHPFEDQCNWGARCMDLWLCVRADLSRERLNSQDSESVDFRLSIENASGQGILFERGINVSAGQEVRWEIPLPALQGAYNVVISTAMTSGAMSNHEAWAIWKRPHFSMIEPWPSERLFL